MGKVFGVSNDESGENKFEGQVLGLGAVSGEFDCGNVVRFYLVCYKKMLIANLSLVKKWIGSLISSILFTFKCEQIPFYSRPLC